jgi:ankyrin repeat protein
MFDDEDHLESRNFPPIHKILLGLVKNDLRQQLTLSTSAIDDTDIDGRTALSWAAAKGDADAVNILLEFGADPNLCSNRGQSPLQWAGQNPSKRCAEILQALLDHNADVNLVDHWNRIVLVNAAGDLDDLECLRILIDAGSHLDWRDCHKRTPLGYAAKGGKTETVSYLISRGANPRIPDHWGYAPIHEAVEQNYHRVLERLLQEDDIIPTAKAVNGMTILHIVALHGDIQTIRLLTTKEEIQNLDPGERNDDGLTPQDLFDARENATPELRHAFRALIEAITLRNDDTLEHGNMECNDGYGDSDADGEFTDAVEFQNF